MVTNRPTIAVSRCLLGETVRYDGRSKPQAELIEAIANHCEIIPVCPEVEAGLSTPRPAVELVLKTTGDIIARGRDDHAIDITPPLNRQITRFIQQHPTLDAALLQNRSPSCGVEDTPRFTLHGEQESLGDGLFTAALRDSYPGILITSPHRLKRSGALRQFLLQIRNTKTD